jgi:hypothetical protein
MSYFDQYQKKKAEIEEARLWAFSSQGLFANICGIKVYHLTAEAWIDLRCKNNGMLNGIPSYDAILQYLQRVSVKFPLNMLQKAVLEFKLWRAFKSSNKSAQLIHAILAHIECAFDEMPEAANGSNTRNFKIAEVEGIVTALDEIGARYGMHPQMVAKMPMRQIFALQKSIRLSTIPNYKILEPKVLRDIKSKHLRAKAEANG